ncbi:protein of unknown function [Taphrina deformans PYCC 5710]|uniref:Uncharacterized protein n=1 Tax=Taphrina deformans (strain PYCC 5710 / ATCC 11124 / CBS 356.35 / IMI 108563 / JCM 9778 / NBRC 8474) TaxID=1097556 RepID=R4X9P9_TAPDE|nr:protein of unknown function [Taphrina deformans PYCC 5710]|eukprot:CCG82165.1 protein of unknown function [Taphrina deformans PYCC 5710]
MDNKLLEKTRNKLKHDLSGEEQEALRQCSATINRHTRIGAILGGSLSVYGMYRRKLWPLTKYPGRGLFFGVGGIVVGMQLGLVTASMACVRIVKALPDPDHVMKALREVQVELQDARRRPLGQAREWNQKGENDGEDGEVAPTGEFGREGVSFGQGQVTREDASSTVRPTTPWDQSPYQDGKSGERIESGADSGLYNGSGPVSISPDAKNRGSVGTQKEQSQNIWQQIRGENANRPETAWDRLRKTGSSSAPKPVDDGNSPFSTTPASNTADSSDAPPRPSYKDGDVQARDKQQDEFDRLLERERQGEAEDAKRTRNKFGDYN